MLKYHCPSLQPLFIYVYYIEGKSACFSLCYWCRESTGRGRCDVAKSHVMSLWQWNCRLEWFVLNHGHVLLIWGHWMTARGLLMMLYQVCLLQLTGTHPTIQTASLICCQTWYGIILTNVYIYLLLCVCVHVWECVCLSVCLYISNVTCTVCLLTIIHYKVVSA